MAEDTTVVRAFELPVHAVDAGSRDGWALLRECWHNATDLANWAVQTLLRADVVRLPGLVRLPRHPGVRGAKLKGLYGLASEAFGFKGGWWAGACVSASTLLRGVERKYMAERLEVVWRRSRAPATYRYPHPWPVHAQGWKAAGFDAAGKPFVRCALPGGEVTLRLRGGPEFGRQLALFRQVAAGDLPRLQLVVRQQGASPSCHRPAVADRGGARRVMVKMVARLPAAPRPGGRCLALLTDPACFWVAELDGRRAWVLNADHIRRGLAAHAEHSARLLRLAQDRKAERRLGGRTRGIQRRLERLCAKHRDRVASWTHEAAAHLAGFAARQGVGEVLYLDRDRGFVPSFPWHELRSRLADKLAAAGIGFYAESLEGEGPAPGGPGPGENGAVDIGPTTPEEDSTWLRVTRLRETAARKLLAARRRSGSHPAASAP